MNDSATGSANNSTTATCKQNCCYSFLDTLDQTLTKIPIKNFKFCISLKPMTGKEQ